MPGGLEYVKAKHYEPFKLNTEALWKKPDLPDRGRRAKRPPNEKQREGGGGPAKGKGGAGDGRQFTGARATRQERTSSSSDVARRGRGGKGDVEWGTPRMGQNPTQWAHAERIRPTALGSAPERRPHYGPDRTPLTGNRQFEALGPGHKPVTAADQRSANLAALVRDTPKQTPLSGGREHNARGMSIITGEIVPERTNTREIKAVGPASRDARTGPIPRIKQARAGDTQPLDTITPRTEHATAAMARTSIRQFTPVTSRKELPSGQRAITATPQIPKHLALTERAEPLGQMSLFNAPGTKQGDLHLASAKTGRTERQNTVPPSLAAGRQLSMFHPAHFKMT